ncbi:dihydrolipoyl dehydrogenase [Bacillaceae bacterium]
MVQEFDLVVLGGGTGGYVAAVRAAQLGMSVAVVEKDKLGGTCLHRGCIPSKALLRCAEVFASLREGEAYGICANDVVFDLRKAQQRKKKIVDQLHKGVRSLLQKGKIPVVHGTGRILGPSIFSPQAGTVSVQTADGENVTLLPRYLLIATGSRPRTLPGLEVDGRHVLTSDEMLELEALPRSVLIIGGGAIGIEWASLFSDLGVDVTLVEALPRILPGEDEEVSKEMARLLQKRKVKIFTAVKVLPETLRTADGTAVLKAEKNGKEFELAAEKVLVSVGRRPNVEEIGLENTNVRVENGAIQVNAFMQTTEPHIYAIGDVTGGLMLAHVAARQAVIAVEHIAGLVPEPLEIANVPRCTYSRPEVASVGLTEEEAKAKGYRVKTGKFPFRAIGKALVYGECDGFVKVISDEETNDLLGVHMIGPHVTDLVSEMALAKLLDATPWEIAQAIHPHPTLSEIFAEAALAVEGRPIHG